MSESGKSHLGHVLDRWKDILKHLQVNKIEFKELEDFLSEGTFAQRYNRQVLPIHIAAYYLMPSKTLYNIRNDDRAIPLKFEQQVTGFFRRYSSSEADAKVLICEFVCFRAQQTPFEPARCCWEQWDKPKLFWEAAAGLTKFLSPLAIRLFSTPVNSVAS